MRHTSCAGGDVPALRGRRATRRRSRTEEPDFLDELVAEGTKRDPEFPYLVEAAYQRMELLHRLVKARVRAGLTQAQVAERMKTSQAAVARIESGDFDVRTTTLDRYAIAVGRRIQYRLSAAS